MSKSKAEPAFNGTVKEGFKRRYTILNERDYKKYINEDLKEEFEEVFGRVLDTIQESREVDGKKPFNNYVVINLDEPYINEVIEIMKRNGHWDKDDPHVSIERLLSTIQKREKLNHVYTVGKKGNGGAYHTYSIYHELWPVGSDKEIHKIADIQFQNGPRKEPNSIPGVIDSDLLEIVRHRLQCFQEGEFSTRENAIALTHVEEALLWMNKRVEDRIERSVLGTMNK